MRWCEIKKEDIADGPGIRVSLFVSGCTHHCKGCFNEGTWDFGAGELFTSDTEALILEAGGKSYISGLTLLGGEPFEPENQECLVPLLKKWRAMYPDKDVWCYTGCVLEKDLLSPSRWRTGHTDEMLSLIDVLVDGPFVESLKDISLKFRGSSNQRILDMRNGEVKLWQ
ncbi:MAG: anaerobic ribonucleoside-triphosphate reductase activating protein [Kiritimatiellae bacterium]|nr:anaerobic ribonucleoside-triphosphate reductase activating protein [Kiritimatiellia bacterium]